MAEVAHTPPIPLDHGILLELHKELVKEYDNGTEGAVARWLEHMLPQFGRGGAEELEKVHSTVDDFKAWVEQVEAALKVEEAVATTATLLQNWQVKTKAAETLPGAENCTLRACRSCCGLSASAICTVHEVHGMQSIGPIQYSSLYRSRSTFADRRLSNDSKRSFFLFFPTKGKKSAHNPSTGSHVASRFFPVGLPVAIPADRFSFSSWRRSAARWFRLFM